MGFFEIILIGVSLSMDAFAVAICSGLKMTKIDYKKAALIALFFGGFQAIMPALGCDDDVETLFARRHITPNIRYTTIENFSAMSMVEQGLGVSVMNRLITEKRICDVAMIPIDPPASITLGAALHSHTEASPAVKMFLKYAVRMLTRTES